MKIIQQSSISIRTKINITLSFTFYSYCLNPVDMINRIINSNIYSISITSIHDIVPSIIKAKKYFKILKLLHFIKCSNRHNINYQILEVNYNLYRKYFPFHNRHKIIGNSIVKLYKSKNKVGVHVRLNDKCIKSCSIDKRIIFKIINISNKLCNKHCFIFLSSFNKNFTQLFMNLNKNTYTFNSTYNIKHSLYYNTFNQIDIDKIVLDIYLTSKCDYLLLSGYSTFSLLILYKGFYKDYTTCNSKYFKFWNNGELYDHLDKFRKNYKCRNITFF